MRIAHVHPTYWPEVMRGSERFIHDLATLQAEAGHEVTILTSHRAPTSVTVEEGVSVVRRRRPPQLPPLRWYEHNLVNVPNVVAGLRRGHFDIAHVHFPSDAWGASLARRAGGPPFVFTLHGMPTRRYLVARRYRLEMLTRAVGAAAWCTVGSEAAAAPFRRYLLREPEVIPPGIRITDFVGERPRAERPTLLCAASLGDPRKRAGLLFEAFERLRARRPEVRLWVLDAPDPIHGTPIDGLPPAVERLPATTDAGALADLYAASWVSVLPAVEEAFGIVLTESLAAGTPVVADRSGAAPELIAGDPAVGRLFERDDPADLARAMAEALDLGADPATAERCRRRAADYDWVAIAGRWEQVYERVLA